MSNILNVNTSYAIQLFKNYSLKFWWQFTNYTIKRWFLSTKKKISLDSDQYLVLINAFLKEKWIWADYSYKWIIFSQKWSYFPYFLIIIIVLKCTAISYFLLFMIVFNFFFFVIQHWNQGRNSRIFLFYFFERKGGSFNKTVE